MAEVIFWTPSLPLLTCWRMTCSLSRILSVIAFGQDARCFECGAESVFVAVEAEVFQVFAVAVTQFWALVFEVFEFDGLSRDVQTS